MPPAPGFPERCCEVRVALQGPWPGREVAVGPQGRWVLHEGPWGHPRLPGPPCPGPFHSITELPVEILIPFAVF